MSHHNGGSEIRARLRGALAERQGDTSQPITLLNGRRIESLTGLVLNRPLNDLGRLQQERGVQLRNDFFRCLVQGGLPMEEILRRFSADTIHTEGLSLPMLMALAQADDNGNYPAEALDVIYQAISVEGANTNRGNVLRPVPLGNTNRRRRLRVQAIGNGTGPAGRVSTKIAEAAEDANVQVSVRELAILLDMLTKLVVRAGCYEFVLSKQVFDSLVAWWNVLA